jgi:hypothetical protein
MPTIKFSTNVPVELRLRSIEGKPVESQFGGVQHMFSAEEGAFYVSETVGAILTEQFRKLHAKPGDLVEICKAEVTAGGRKRIQWQVAQVGYYPGEQPNGTLAVPKPPAEAPGDLEQKLAQSIAQVEARKQAQQAQSAAPPPAWALALVDQTNALVDAFASVVRHSARHEGLIKADDVRSIFLSAYINATKAANGGRNAA